MSDLVNLRWAHVRAIEKCQLQQQEILHLKELLRQKENEFSSYKSNFLSQRNGLKKPIVTMQQVIVLLKADLEKIKAEYTFEIKASKENLWKLKTSSKELELRCGNTSQVVDRMTIEIKMLKQQLEDNEESSKKLADKASADNKAIASKLDEVTENFQRALRDCDMKDQALLAIREEKNVVDERLALSKEKIAQLQRAMKKMQEDASRGASDIERDHKRQCGEYEERIEMLEADNSEMSEDIRHLQKEIERLIAAQNVPRKSNFSKYVELKTENATLQAQMTEITRRQSVMGNRRMSSLGSSTGEQEPLVGAGAARRASRVRRQTTLPSRQGSVEVGGAAAGAGGAVGGADKSGNRITDDRCRGGSTDTRLTPDENSLGSQSARGNQQSALVDTQDSLGRLPPSGRRPSHPSGGVSGSVLGIMSGGETTGRSRRNSESSSTSRIESRRHSAINDDDDGDGSDADASLSDMTPPPIVAPAMNVVVTSSPKGERKISPRPSQYRSDSGTHTSEGSSIDVTGSTEPPVYTGMPGSNLRRKSGAFAAGSSLARASSGAAGGAGGAPRKSVISLNDAELATSTRK